MSNDVEKRKVFKSLIWRFGERITAQLISLLVSILLARLLAPEDYGAVAIVMIFITFANVFVSCGLGNALIQKKDADDIDFSSVFYVNILMSMGLYILLFFIAPLIANFYEMPILLPTLRVLGIRIPVAAINSVQQAYVSRYMLFKRFFWSTLFGTLISGVVGILMAYSGYGVWALIFQYLTNTCIDTIVLWFTVRWRPKKAFSWKKSKALIGFGWKVLVSGFIDTGYRQLRNLIIGKKYSRADLAYYNQGDKYPSLIVTNVNTSISSVLFPALSHNQDEVAKVKQMTKRSIQVSSYVMWPMMIGLAAVATPFVRVILTDKWLPSVPYLRIFCISYGLWPIHTSNLQAINALGRSDIFLKMEIIKKSVGFITLLISMQFSPLVMAYSLIIVDVISTIVNSFPNRRLLNYSYFEQIKDMGGPLLLSLLMGICVYCIGFIRINEVYLLIIQLCSGVAIYLLLSIIFKVPSFYYLLNILRKRKEK